MDTFASPSRSPERANDPTGRSASGIRLQVRWMAPGFLPMATALASMVLLLLGSGWSPPLLHASPRPGSDTLRSAVTEAGAVRRFEVVCDTPCPGRVIAMASAAAEAAWEESIALLGAAPPVDEPPLRIFLYRSLETWQAVEAELTGGRFAENRSFAHAPSRSAHLVLPPGLPDAVLARYGPTPRTLRLVAHEAFHLVSMLALPSASILPEWLAEGAATWIEQRVAERQGWSRGLTGDPIPSTYLWTARRLLYGNRLPTARSLVHFADGRASSGNEYALSMLLVTHLRQEWTEELDLILATAARLEPADPGSVFLLRRTIENALGGPDYGDLDRSWRAFLAARRPAWVEVSRSLETAGNSWVQGGGDAGALAWRTEPVAGGSLVVEGVAEFPGGSPSTWMRVTLGEESGGHVEVRMNAAGDVWATRIGRGEEPGAAGERLRPSADGGGTLGSGQPDEPPPSRPAPFPFRIVAGPGGLDVSLGGTSRLTLPPTSLSTDGSWGLGTGPGATVVWHNLRVSPGEPFVAALGG